MLQCVAARCSALQCVVVRCSVWQYIAVYCSVLQCIAVYCTMLHCGAVRCSVLQCVTIRDLKSEWETSYQKSPTSYYLHVTSHIRLTWHLHVCQHSFTCAMTHSCTAWLICPFAKKKVAREHTQRHRFLFSYTYTFACLPAFFFLLVWMCYGCKGYGRAWKRYARHLIWVLYVITRALSACKRALYSNKIPFFFFVWLFVLKGLFCRYAGLFCSYTGLFCWDDKGPFEIYCASIFLLFCVTFFLEAWIALHLICALWAIKRDVYRMQRALQSRGDTRIDLCETSPWYHAGCSVLHCVAVCCSLL